MTDPTIKCPKCAAAMEKGYIADLAEGVVLQSAWTRGVPKPRRVIGGIRWNREENIAIITFRCESCGYLESYAARP